MRDALIWIGIGVAVLAVLTIPLWLPVYHRWIDARTVRRINARRAAMHTVKRDPFPAVKFDEDLERRREEQRWN